MGLIIIADAGPHYDGRIATADAACAGVNLDTIAKTDIPNDCVTSI